jgi:hypothetical protein
MNKAPKIAIIENNPERISEFRNLTKQVGYEGEITFFKNGGDLIDFINFNIQDFSQIPELVFVNITTPVLNGRSFLVEYESLAESIKEHCQIITYSSNIKDCFFIANDYNYQPIDFNPSFSELFDGFILSDSVKCFA